MRKKEEDILNDKSGDQDFIPKYNIFNKDGDIFKFNNNDHNLGYRFKPNLKVEIPSNSTNLSPKN